jgi:O-antigen ligase
MNIKNASFINSKTLNILFLFFPVAFLMGNAAININVLLICITGIVVFRKKIFSFKNERLSAVILIFFILVLVSTLIDISKNPKNDHFFKSIAYFRYFFLFLVSSCLVRSGKFKIKYFLVSCLVCLLFLSLDVTYQFLNGSDIFGFVDHSPNHLAGFLRNEYVAGGYIQKFFVFALILIPIIWKKLDKPKFLISTALPIIFFSGILFSGNRMPLVMFCISILLMIILIKELRLPLTIASLFCVLIFTISIKMNDNLRAYHGSFYDNSSYIMKNFSMTNIKKYAFKNYPKLERGEKKYFVGKLVESENQGSSHDLVLKYDVIPGFGSGHLIIYLTAIDIWIDNPIIGNGIKSFRIKCWTKLHLPNRVCSSHPHNYYLELLNDTGLLGTLFLVCVIFYLITNKFFNFKYYEKNEKLLFICLLIIIIAEFFPLKSSGSFFSTTNSSFIFLILGILNGLKKIKE